MKLMVHDGEHKLIICRSNVSAVDMVEVFRIYASIGDYTVEVECLDETVLFIGIHESKYTLTILTPEPEVEVYNCTSCEKSQGEVDFVLGGQPIQWDRKYLVSKARVEATLKQFVHGWKDMVRESRWEKEWSGSR